MEAVPYDKVQEKVEEYIRKWVIPWTKRFIEIPNLSRAFDATWNTNGLLQKACELCLDYAKEINIKGLDLKLHQDEGKTPIVFGSIESTRKEAPKNLMFYGHIDKQPHLTQGWREGLSPIKGIEEKGLLYGRGGVDDGYNFFTILALVKSLQDLDIPHDRMTLFYECDEESASIDVPYYIKKFTDVIKKPDVMFCLDSGSISNNIFSISTTLRGCLNFDLKVQCLEKGMHSGVGTGIVASTFRICRLLLDRIECPKSGKIIEDLQVEIPSDKKEQAAHCAKVQGEGVFKSFCFCKGVKPISEDVEELYLNNIWRSQLEVTGQRGIPDLSESGNVLREFTTLRCSLRLPPTFDGKKAFEIIHETLTKDPPYGAHITVTEVNAGNGWSSNEVPGKVIEILDRHNQAIFGTKTLMYGCGGSIPFIKTLQDELPDTLLFVSGIVLPDSNMHAPNENLDIEYLVKFTKSLTCFLIDYANLPSLK